MAIGDWFNNPYSNPLSGCLRSTTTFKSREEIMAEDQAQAHALQQAHHQYQVAKYQAQAAQQQLTTNSTSNGLGSIVAIPSGQMTINPGAFGGSALQYPNPSGTHHPYMVQLPTKARKHDYVKIYYDGVKWLEETSFGFDNPAQQDHAGGFSLAEIEEAEKIMEECSAR